MRRRIRTSTRVRIAAGHATKTKKIGFVAAKPIPQVLLNVNSFLQDVDLGLDIYDRLFRPEIYYAPGGAGGQPLPAPLPP